MTSEALTIKSAREAAAKLLGQATSELLKSAETIAENYGLPEGINGLSRPEFLGRMTFIVSMSRDLKRAGEEELAAKAIKKTFKNSLAPAEPIAETIEVKPGAKDDTPALPLINRDITDLSITVQAVKALKTAGIHQIAELDLYTDAALMAIPGIAAPSVAAIRKAISEFRTK